MKQRFKKGCEKSTLQYSITIIFHEDSRRWESGNVSQKDQECLNHILEVLVIVDSKTLLKFTAATASSRNSVLLQLIAWRSSALAKAKSSSCVKPSGSAMKRGIGNNNSGMFCKSDIGKRVLWKNAVKMVVDEDQDHDMINYISKNPRFGNLQAQEKEYFSGSIVEPRVRRWESNSQGSHLFDWWEFDFNQFKSMRIRLIDRSSILIDNFLGNSNNLYWNFEKCKKISQINLTA